MILEQYQSAEMEIIEFEAEDIICTSKQVSPMDDTDEGTVTSVFEP